MGNITLKQAAIITAAWNANKRAQRFESTQQFLEDVQKIRFSEDFYSIVGILPSAELILEQGKYDLDNEEVKLFMKENYGIKL